MADNEKKIKEIDEAIRIAENPLNIAPGGEIAGRGYVIDRLNEYKELLKEQLEIVPCKNCGNCKMQYPATAMRKSDKVPYCIRHRLWVTDDFFCADGKPKE